MHKYITRKVKVLSLPETIKENSTFPTKTLRWEDSSGYIEKYITLTLTLNVGICVDFKYTSKVMFVTGELNSIEHALQ